MNIKARVFMEIGEFTTEGFIKGIESTANQIKGTMNNVYGSLGDSAKKMANGNSSISNVSNNVNRSQNYGDIYLTISPRDVQEFNSIVDLFKNLQQQMRAR